MAHENCDHDHEHDHSHDHDPSKAAETLDDIPVTLYDLSVDPQTNLVILKAGSAPSNKSEALELGKTITTINELTAMLSRAPFPHCPPMTPPPPPGFVGAQQNIRYAQIQKVKDDGNIAYNKKDYPTAIQRYSMAADMAASRALFENSGWAREEISVMLSNRAAAYAAMKKWSEALVDAEAVIKLKRNWSKGHFRKSKTLQAMGRMWEAKDAVLLGLEFEPDNKDLCALRDQLDETLEASAAGVAVATPRLPTTSPTMSATIKT